VNSVVAVQLMQCIVIYTLGSSSAQEINLKKIFFEMVLISTGENREYKKIVFLSLSLCLFC
jgi:hypothetical protein